MIEERPDKEAILHARAEPLRVLHCMWGGSIGGAERAVYLLVREQMRDPTLAPALLYAQPGGPYWQRAQELGCPVVTANLKHGRSLASVGKIARAMRAFDIHHFHSAEPLLMLGSVRCKGVRRVYTHRGGITHYPLRKRAQYAVTGALLRNSFHAFSGNTRHATTCAAQILRMKADDFEVTYNGLDFDLLEPQRAEHEVRAEIGIPESAFVVGTAAHLRPWKRIDVLIRAIVEVDDPAVRLLILGDGPDRGRLESLAAQVEPGGRIVFAGAKTDVADYLNAMDAFCLPSMALESFGNAAVEAMALGLPTIVFADGGGLTEHVQNGATGLVVGSEAELVIALRRLITDPDVATRLGEAGRAAVRARYTPPRAARAYRSLYAAAYES
jgi:glycosyltransferase involved in cell wall biosynthesis